MKKVISGGERKRTAIAVELITDPNVVLLDEPTSGLDSFTAVKIVKILRKLAREQGKTICATIHQPSSEAFAFFDRLILMCDGNIVF
jgi:ABC-type multidrug transport system ATPase subunit